MFSWGVTSLDFVKSQKNIADPLTKVIIESSSKME